MKRSPGWAIGGWFIPIGNLFIPYGVVVQAWNRSIPSDNPGPEATEEDVVASSPLDISNLQPNPDYKGSGFILVWWLVWVASELLSNYDYRLYMRAETLEDLHNSAGWTILSEAVAAIAAVLAIIVVRKITQRQHKAALAVESSEDKSPPPISVLHS